MEGDQPSPLMALVASKLEHFVLKGRREKGFDNSGSDWRDLRVCVHNVVQGSPVLSVLSCLVIFI